MNFRTEQARERYDGLVDLAPRLVVALDFDGTLSPIVADPAAAAIHPDAPAMLGHLAARVRAVVVITGRPARQVVGSDNWYGTISASTVYYPARLKAQAELLGKDLGISRLKPTIAPMRGDRLTVILTRDYS